MFTEGDEIVFTEGDEIVFTEGDEIVFTEGDEIVFTEGDEIVFTEGDEIVFTESDEIVFTEGDELGSRAVKPTEQPAKPRDPRSGSIRFHRRAIIFRSRAVEPTHELHDDQSADSD